MVTYTCAAKHLCGMMGCPLTKPQHHCMQCGGPTHSAALCGVLWSDRDTSAILIEKDVCSERAQGLWDSNTSMMCNFCVDDLKDGHLKPSVQKGGRRTSRASRSSYPRSVQERGRRTSRASRSSRPRGVAPISVAPIIPPIIALDDAPDLPTEDIHSGLCNVSAEQPSEDATTPALNPIKSIWACEKMTKKIIGDVDGWNCGWCMNDFKPVHATRAMAHVLKLPNNGVITCKAVIPHPYFHRYYELHNRKINRRDASNTSLTRISDGINKRQAICLHGSEETAALVDLSDVIDVDAASTISSVTGASSAQRSKKSRVSLM
jgi:hypothetical protein